MAYRSPKAAAQGERATTGLVVEMVEQFSDRYAFVRELVQNGLDAGASSLEVRLSHLGGEARFAVRDDGQGMTRAIIEGPLLTLFNSEKDRDPTKIGKYGVGFVSVFAIDPDEVRVSTWRAGECWELVLFPDHSWELREGERPAGASASGTEVALHKRAGIGAFRTYRDETTAALTRWCRHARVPIHLVVDEQGAEPLRRRVDVPLTVASPVSLTVVDDDTTLCVGPSASEEDGARPTRAAFFNRGLTLFETTQPVHRSLLGMTLAVDSPHLSHTLSRDNIRHDHAYKVVVRRALRIVEEELRHEVVRKLGAAARASIADREARRELPVLLYAACTECLGLGAAELAVPLCDGAGERVSTLDGLVRGGSVLYETEPSPLTAALAAAGRPVVWAPDWPAYLCEALARRARAAMVWARSAYGLLRPLDKHGRASSDEALTEALTALLRAAGEEAREVALGSSFGAELEHVAVRVPSARGAQLVPAGERARRLRFRRPSAWLVVASHPFVGAIREAAREDAWAAAHLLARAMLVEDRGELSATVSDRLLSALAEGS